MASVQLQTITCSKAVNVSMDPVDRVNRTSDAALEFPRIYNYKAKSSIFVALAGNPTRSPWD